MTRLEYLGFDTNCKGHRSNQRFYEEYVSVMVFHIADLDKYNLDVKLMIEALADFFSIHESSMAEQFYKVVRGFGTSFPTKNDYPDFSHVLHPFPSKRKVKNNPFYQNHWDIMSKWMQKYEKTMIQNIVSQKNKKIQQLEIEIKAMDERIGHLESYLEKESGKS